MTKRVLKVLFVGAMVFHFGLMIAFNITQCMKTHWDLYNSKDPAYAKVDETTMSLMRSLSVFYNYQNLTGTNTAYAFYAPQVCGHLEPFFQVYQGEEKIKEHYNIALKTAEAGLRLEAVFGGNLERLEDIVKLKDEKEAREKIDYRLLDIKMHSLATRVLNQIGAAITSGWKRSTRFWA